MAKLTAVEWLFQQLWDEPKDKFTWYALREKAIKMEKEQLENARPQIISNCIIKEISDEEIYKEAEKHYRGLALTRFVQGAKWYREQLNNKNE